jgi:phosphoglycolate phosphatase-like HAD superfamily hydrolase
MIKAIIFDVGGTLLGATDLLENILVCNASIEAHDDIYNQLGKEFFRQITDCRNGSTFKSVVEIIDRAVGVVNKENNNCLPSVNAGQVYQNTFVNDSFVINDADLALEKLSDKNIELIIASDADAEFIHAQFRKYKWDKYISKYFVSSEIKAYKPNDVFVAALSNAVSNYQKDEVILVGDSDVDIATGKKLGVKTALISRNNQKQYNEDYSIASLLQLLDI